jgi:hypothetical protein
VFLKCFSRVREHSLFGFRWSNLVVFLDSNEYIFIQMDNARRHRLFYQNRNQLGQHTNALTHSLRSLGKIHMRIPLRFINAHAYFPVMRGVRF